MDPVTLGMAQADARKRYSAKRNARAVAFSPLPGYLNNTYAWNASAFSQDAVTTSADGTTQYAIWVDNARHPIVGKRTLPDGPWTTYDLTAVAGNPFVNLTETDNHNIYVIAVDPQGRIWVAGNMHGSLVLRAVRSNAAGDITAWTAVSSMVGTEENSMSYPRFIKRPTDGALFYSYRNGVSGDGNTYLNRWNGTTWVRVAQLTDGETSNQSAYETKLRFDQQGRLCYMFTWRDNLLGNSDTYNNASDLSFFRSTSSALTAWETVDGTPVTLPVTKSNAPVVLATAPRWSGLYGQAGFDIDRNGNPHYGGLLHDGDITLVRTEQPNNVNRQLVHVWHDNTGWHRELITKFTTTMCDRTHRPAVPSIFCLEDRTYMLYSHKYEGRNPMGVLCIDATPGSDHVEFPLMEWAMRDIGITYDTEAFRLRGELHMLVTPINVDDSAPLPEYWSSDNYSKQLGGVLAVDLKQLDKLQAGTVNLPRWRPIGMSTLVTPTGLSGFTGGPTSITVPFQIPGELRDRIIGVRLSVRGKVTTGSVSVFPWVSAAGSANGAYAPMSLPFTTNSSATKATPIVPLNADGPRNGFDTSVNVRATVTGGGSATFDAVTLEFFVLDGPVVPRV